LPFVFTPGNNEWLNCKKAKQHGGTYKATPKMNFIYASTAAKSATDTPFSHLGIPKGSLI